MNDRVDTSRVSRPGPALLVLLLCAVVGGVVALDGGVPTVRAGDDGRPGWNEASVPAGRGESTGEAQRKPGPRGLYAITIAQKPAAPVPLRHRRALAGRTAGLTAARAAAGRSPGDATKLERDFAASVEADRNAAMHFLARRAKAELAVRARVVKQLERAGVAFAKQQPLADAVVVRATPTQLARVQTLAGVAAAAEFEQPQPLANPVEGSPTWHAAGFNGQAPNPDLPTSTDGPDVVVWDTGVSTGHDMFRSRQASDCATCLGTGASQDQDADGNPRSEAGPHTRVFSPSSRTDFTGSEHGNVIAASIAGTDFTRPAGAGRGISYGVDKLYDVWPHNPDLTCGPNQWFLGVDCGIDVGVPDLPEVLNHSWGNVQDAVAHDPDFLFADEFAHLYGITWVNSAGNCGQVGDCVKNVVDPGNHRIDTPANLHNVLTVGGLNPIDPANHGTWRVWEHSSPGPTWDGRKKPDLIATPYGGVSHAKTNDEDSNGKLDDYGNNGIGTSFAAPQVTAAAALLASIGVYSPMAQRAILINSARPIQNQTYWTPTSGWGALDLAAAFPRRSFWRTSDVSGAGVNGARFFALSGAQVGDRATLAWNRRVNPQLWGTRTYWDLTNLDLSQISPADPTGATVTSTGGSDAADSVDSNLTASGAPGNNAVTDNPMPGSGQDAGDNVEQIRSTASGNQILKVKAHSPVDQLGKEPFAVAASSPITALSTPIPNVTLTPSTALTQTGAQISITVQVTNPSNDLALGSASVGLGTLPAGVVAVGASSVNLGTINAGGSASTSFTVQGSTDGVKEITVSATGTTYGEPFGGSEEATITFDGTPPEVTLDGLPEWSTTATPTTTWSATDALGTVASYDVEVQIAGGPWERQIDAGAETSLQLAGAAEGESIAVRVRARDALGNLSGWSLASTTADAIEPEVQIGDASYPRRGTIVVPVGASNVGAPLTATSYRWFGNVPLIPLTATSVTHTNRMVDQAQQLALTVIATDATGRTVSRTMNHLLEPREADTKPGSARLRISKVKVAHRVATIGGSLRPGLGGTVRMEIRRRGKRGTRLVVRRLKVKNNRFNTRVRLAPGNYRVTTTRRATQPKRAATANRSFTIR